MDNNTARRFEHKDEKSSKFWEISVAGNGFTVRYGKIGTAGQTQSKEFADAVTAEKQAQKLIAEKVGKGYLEVGAQEIESPSNQASQPAAKAKAEKPAKVAKPSNAKAETPANIAKNSESTAEVLASLAGSSEAIDRLLAKHPKAGADLLEKLSHSSDKATRKAVCLNPNTSKETLVRLAPQFPGDFFQNPAFDWLLLEDPNLLFNIGGGVLKNILKRPECPVSFLKWAAIHGDKDQQLAVAMNTHTPVESLRELLGSATSSIATAARGHVALAGEQGATEVDPEAAFLGGIAEALAELNILEVRDLLEKGYLCEHQVPVLSKSFQLYLSGYYDVLRTVFKDVPASDLEPVPLLEPLARDKDWHVRFKVASHAYCPVPVLEKLAPDRNWEVRCAVATHPNCPVPVLVKLALDKRWEVRRAVASHANCPVPVLEMLALDKKMDVWCAVVANANGPVPLQNELVKDSGWLVRRKMASYSNCPELLERLSLDMYMDVRENVASNPNCPTNVLEALAHDSHSAVQCAVAYHPACPVPLLEKLAWDRDWNIRRTVASHGNCPTPLLEKLAQDKKWRVRRAVASHHNCPELVLEKLAQDKHLEVRRAVAVNANSLGFRVGIFGVGCSAERNNSLIDEQSQRWIERRISICFPGAQHQDAREDKLLWSTMTLAEKGIYHKFAIVRALALARPIIAMDVLAIHQKHVSWLVRAAVARNRNCPKSALKSLTEDPHRVVSGLARINQSRSAQAGGDLAARVDVLRGSSPDTRLLLDAVALSLTQFDADPDPHLGDALLPWLSVKGKCSFISGASDALPACPSWVLRRLAKDGRSFYKQNMQRVARNPNCPVPILEMLAKDEVNWVRKHVASNPNCPVPILEMLAKDENELVRGNAAYNPNCPVPILEMLTKDGYIWVRIRVGSNPNCPVPVLEMLAKDEESEVRKPVAHNPNCPVQILELLAKDGDSGVRVGVASNPNCPVPVLEMLAKDEESGVRKPVARNPNCLVQILELLAKDGRSEVRKGLASNPNCPVPVLEMLAKDEDYWVRIDVASNSNCPVPVLVMLAKDEESGVRKPVARNPNCPVQILELLAKDGRSEVREGLASNPNCPVPVLEMLAKDEDSGVRVGVASNPSCPAALLEEFAQRGDWYALTVVFANPNCPRHILQSMMKKIQLARSMYSRVRAPLSLPDCIYPRCPPELKLLAALQPDCPKKRLFKSASSVDPLERLAAVLNPMLPTAQVLCLLDDPDVNVQRAAARHPNCKPELEF